MTVALSYAIMFNAGELSFGLMLVFTPADAPL